MRHHKWTFDIDRFLNPFVPPPPWKHVPYPIARWFGYRETKPADTGNLMPIFWAFIGAFCAISIIEAVGFHVPSFQDRHVPTIVGSFGAAAVLEFYAIEAPLAQPRNAIGGQLIAAIVGVAVNKLFQLSPRFDEYYWLGGALACAAATALMALTKTVHPPAGATALLAVVDTRLVAIGWFLIPVMLLGCGLMLGVALLLNNIERRFPIYWWTPVDLRAKKPIFRRRKSTEDPTAGGGDAAEKPDTSAAPAEEPVKPEDTTGKVDGDLEAGKFKVIQTHKHAGEVVIRAGQVVVPEHMYLTQEEEQLLETLAGRI